ncbi:MAG TPA: hypothetical protein VGI06_05045 [Acidimicrobiales bacterium]
MATALRVTDPPAAVPDGLPALPADAAPRDHRWRGPAAAAAVAAAPMIAMLVSVVVGGGPRTESADDALLTMATRDAIRGTQLLGPYSRFGWHHPGPSYFYLLSFPTWIWHGGPTGSWVGATAIGLAAVAATAFVVRRWAGPRGAWWTVVAALAVVTGLGPGLFRDPWNPYVVTLPILFVAVASAFAAAGSRGALAWALVVGSFAVQTHVSTAPVVVGLVVAAAAVQAGRWGWRRAHPVIHLDHIPAELPALAGEVDDRWWTYRPEIAIAVMVLIAEWLPPLWDELFGTGNLTKLVSFFTAPHPAHPWDASWRVVTTMFGITLFQHHGAISDLVGDPHPVVTTVAFVALVVAAIAAGVVRRRPAAVWLGVFGLLAAALAVESVTRVVGPTYHYLVFWMVSLPVLPAIGLAIGLEGVDVGGGLPRRVRPGTVVAAIAVLGMSALGVQGVVRAKPAAALTDKDIASAWRMVAPVVGTNHDPVRVEIADGARWPAAAGIGLELERHGHPVRVDSQWTLLFGARRLSHGNEPIAIIVGTDNNAFPLPAAATLLGQAGPDVVWVRRSGPTCWDGWIPMGGPACPPLVSSQGPTLAPLEPGAPPSS